MKKLLIIGIPVSVIALFFAAYSFGFGSGHSRPHGMMKDFMLWKMERISKELSLNPSQQAKWDAFQRDLISNIDDRMGSRKEIHETVKAELAKGDVNKAKGIIHGQIDDRAQLAHQMVDRIAELYDDLTPEQRNLLLDKIEQMHQRED